jgi:ABC-type uncharacterized transport system auxiliary subunit
MEHAMKKIIIALDICMGFLLMMCSGCTTIFGKMPIKQYYVLNFMPSSSLGGNVARSPYPFTIRIRDFDIEEAYARPQIVYRQNPFELLYYSYKLWAVKPNRMISDLVRKQIVSSGLVSHVVRRYDEGFSPDFELSGLIEAIEEYDSEQLWFAHLAMRLTLTRTSDGRVMYSRRFDNRKKVFRYSPEAVVQELSAILEFIMDQAIRDMNVVLAREVGVSPGPAAGADTARLKEIEKFRSSGGE